MSSGFLNLLKPCGMTSHDVVNRVRKAFKTRAVGHMGTLDPEAAGVLPLAIGRATRLIPLVEGDSKVYRAEVLVGVSTDTYDSHGKVVARTLGAELSREGFEQALQRFLGNIEQIPPMFSAIKVQGKKLYELARAGEEIERAPRSITITRLELLNYYLRPDGLYCGLIEVECSKGTYIRSLCHDLGQVVSIPACMGFLLRMRSGPFTIMNSVTLDELERAPALLDMGSLFSHMPCIKLTKVEAMRFAQGQSLCVAGDEGMVVVYCEQVFLGLAKLCGGLLAPFKVLAREGEIG